MQKLKILMILIGVTIFSSCTTVKHKKIHDPLILPHNCNFKKLTNEEKINVFPKPLDTKNLTTKDRMIESVGRKIYRNQNDCKLRQERVNTLLNTHNEEHKN